MPTVDQGPGSLILPESSPLPIIVGVTGHRDLRDADREPLSKAVKRFLESLKSRYDESHLIVMTALADGADRLVADVALDLKIPLIVPVPGSLDSYRESFSPESDKEFEVYETRRDVFAFELELPEPSASSEISVAELGYQTVGAYIARRCQILLALFDGVDNGRPKCTARGIKYRPGGTAEVVRFKLEGVPEPFAPRQNPLDPLDVGPVVRIATPRVSNPTPVDYPEPDRPPKPISPFEIIELYPSGTSPDAEAREVNRKAAREESRRVLYWMNQFNRDARRHHESHVKEREENRGYVIPKAKEPKLTESNRKILTFYAIADTLARSFQTGTFRALRTVLGLALAAAVAIEVHGHLPWREATDPIWKSAVDVALPIIAGIYLAALAGIYGTYFFVGRWGWQEKYLQYRALAEGLRVCLFWRHVGIRESVADVYLRRHKAELGWIREAIRVWTIRSSLDVALDKPRPATPEQIELAVKHWVEDQGKYFNKAGKRDRAKHEKLERWSLFAFAIGLVLAVVKVFVPADTPWLMPMTLAVVVAALVHVYARVLGFREHATQYRRMAAFFARGTDAIVASNGDASKCQALLRDIGEEALIENGDWLVYHRGRPLEIPK